MVISIEQKQVIDNIISIFETGKVSAPEAYSKVTILKDGAGISYGKHQSTDRADSLDAIIFRYQDLQGGLSEQFIPFLDYLKMDASSKLDPNNPPGWAQDLMKLLSEAGKDPIMQKAQDDIFNEQYWLPAVRQAETIKLNLALSYAILYDTCIHSGPAGVANIRKRFPEKAPSNGGDEKAWSQAYIKARRAWLLANPNPIVKKTIYRMDAFQQIIDSN